MLRNRSDRQIVNALLSHAEARMSQHEFADLAGVSTRTVTNRLPELRKSRIVAKGRWALGPGVGVVLVATADDDHVDAAVIDANGTVHFKLSERLSFGIRTSQPADSLGPAAQLLHRSWRDALAGRINGHPVKPTDLRGICLALPSAIGRDESLPQARGYALEHNEWRSSPVEVLLRPHLHRNLQDAPIDALNDANCDALAVAFDHCRSTTEVSGSHSEIMLAVRLSVGVGIGIVKLAGDDGDVFRLNASTLIVGSEGLAGEFGHLAVSPDVRAAANKKRGPLASMNDLPCSCGAKHHLEGRVGVAALLDRLARTDPTLVPAGESATDLLTTLAGRPSDLVGRALRDVGQSVGVALNGAVLLLDPSHVVFTGPLGLPQVCAAAAQVVQSSASPNRVVIQCAPERVREDVTLIGAGIAVLRKQVLKGIDVPPGTESSTRRSGRRRRITRTAAAQATHPFVRHNR